MLIFDHILVQLYLIKPREMNKQSFNIKTETAVLKTK